MPTGQTEHRRAGAVERWWPVCCALLAYLPALASSPGRMPADTKLALYLDPGRLTAEALDTFDPAQYAGWVPHQQIAYLWPTGPWYSLFETMGVPDWIAHRLWIGTLLFLAGCGVGWALRRFGFSIPAALAGAMVYQLSPYVLPYISRTSSLLLPFAGLGWIIGSTLLALRDERRIPWRWPAVIALVVATVGAVNATALIMIVPGPLLVLAYGRRALAVSWRRIAAVTSITAGSCTAVSLWWIAMLATQRRHGPAVLAYSESLQAVSSSSTSLEALRGLGYWLFYVRDHLGATTTASLDHLDDPAVIALGLAVVILSLVGLVTLRDSRGLLGAACVATGVVVAVGVHPIDDPSLAIEWLVGDVDGGIALALRSSARAVPVAMIGLAFGAAALTEAAPWPRWARRRLGAGTPHAAAAVLVALAIAATPSWWTGALVDPNLDRDPDPPAAWNEAIADIDADESGGRLLQIPGAEFGAFTWGVTVDQPLPYLTDRPVLTRDLLPLGSPPAMDLVFALDDRFQNGTFESRALAPVMSWLGADRAWLVGDLDVQRYDTARPSVLRDQLRSAEDLTADAYGDPVRSGDAVIDEELLGVPAAREPVEPVTIITPTQGGSIIRVRSAEDEIVVVGSGAGIVDAAAGGVVSGTELLRAAPAVDEPASRLLITDSARDRAQHWRTSQDVHGFTEGEGPASGLLEEDDADERLPVFDDAVGGPLGDEHRTVSELRGPIAARATAYGEPFAYLPEHRPSMAVDGDPTTAWTVGEHADPVGERLVIATTASAGGVRLLQPAASDDRVIDRVLLDTPMQRLEVTLDQRSLSEPGQPVDVSLAAGDELSITILSVSDGRPNAVGFSEVDLGLGGSAEWILTPRALPPTTPDTQVDVVLTRLRAEPTDRWRDDPEPTLRRVVTMPDHGDADVRDLTASIRLDPRADPAVLAEILGEAVVASDHLLGAPAARGSAAFDGDDDTAWISPFGTPVGPSLTFPGLSGTSDSLGITQPDGSFSRITSVSIDDVNGRLDVVVPADGSITRLDRAIDLATARLTVTGAELATTIDRRFGDEVVLPSAIAELDLGVGLPAGPDSIAVECDTGWLTIDGVDVPLRFRADLPRLLAGEPALAEPCSDVAPTGESVTVEGSPPPGFQLDRVTWSTHDAPTGTTSPPVWSAPNGADPRRVTIDACPAGCWVVLGHGYNRAWAATTDSGSLGDPELVDGNANGWWLEPFDEPVTVRFSWNAQQPVTLATLASLTAAAVLVGALLAGLRRTRRVTEPSSPPDQGRPIDWRVITSVYAATVLLFVAPPYLVGVAAVTIVLRPAVGRRRTGALVALSAVAALSLIGVLLCTIVVREHPFPGLSWPARFGRWHEPVLFLLLTLVAGVARNVGDRRYSPT